jgi:hypothetical protein
MATVDQQIAEVKLGFLCHPKKSPAIASHGAKRLRALPKSCHLLPPAATCCHFVPQNRYGRFNRSISFLTHRRRAGQPLPGAENRERGQVEPW